MNPEFELLAERLSPPTRKQLSLDSEYKNHYALFVLNNGHVDDSRIVNWRRVQWEKVDKIILRIKGHEHIFVKHPSNHKFFLQFRQQSLETDWEPARALYRELISKGYNKEQATNKAYQYCIDNRQEVRKKINIWTSGVTDGTNCYLVDVDHHYGTIMEIYVKPLKYLMGHIHPRIQALNILYRNMLYNQ